MATSHSVVPDDIADVVAANVRAERARRKVTQRDLADRLGVTQQAISLKLSGARPFTAGEIATVADVLEVDPGTLLKRSGS